MAPIQRCMAVMCQEKLLVCPCNGSDDTKSKCSSPTPVRHVSYLGTSYS
ncbi:hypothetical protein Pcar_3452 [Syntrophotalea carbinolica DSM 2380]|uniref:Uncharacterized protein n=1 Tax=Syntrophotalea carbinolica (strain DSM 2380 / NBRC 103641 / GraBd1) TaxID=338963 RepID=J9U9Z4_SYNC1|nr:hypothetical protein Pcar_3452 [Syntrophotalea carbinolica DSM 2380]